MRENGYRLLNDRVTKARHNDGLELNLTVQLTVDAVVLRNSVDMLCRLIDNSINCLINNQPEAT